MHTLSLFSNRICIFSKDPLFHQSPSPDFILSNGKEVWSDFGNSLANSTEHILHATVRTDRNLTH